MSRKNAGDPGPTTTLGCFALGARIVLFLAMVAGVVDCFALFAMQFFEPLREASRQVNNPLGPLMGLIHDGVVRDIGGVDVAPLIALGLIVFAWYVAESLLSPATPEDGKASSVPSRGRAAVGSAAPIVPSPVSATHHRPIGPVSGEAAKKRRMDLLREIAAQKRIIEKATGAEREAAIAAIHEKQEELKAQEKHLAFLALDVVGSTKMKASENKLIVEHAFLAFREWADGIMKRHGLWKSSWTPDGVMAAFPDADEAVASAQEILKGLRQFNKEGHEMGVPFQLRLGVSLGSVIFDDEARMDEVSHQVIDLAGHLQKYASPDTLLMAKQDHDRLRSRRGFRSAGRTVDGHDTLEWTP